MSIKFSTESRKYGVTSNYVAIVSPSSGSQEFHREFLGAIAHVDAPSEGRVLFLEEQDIDRKGGKSRTYYGLFKLSGHEVKTVLELAQVKQWQKLPDREQLAKLVQLELADERSRSRSLALRGTGRAWGCPGP